MHLQQRLLLTRDKTCSLSEYIDHLRYLIAADLDWKDVLVSLIPIVQGIEEISSIYMKVAMTVIPTVSFGQKLVGNISFGPIDPPLMSRLSEENFPVLYLNFIRDMNGIWKTLKETRDQEQSKACLDAIIEIIAPIKKSLSILKKAEISDLDFKTVLTRLVNVNSIIPFTQEPSAINRVKIPLTKSIHFLRTKLQSQGKADYSEPPDHQFRVSFLRLCPHLARD